MEGEISQFASYFVICSLAVLPMLAVLFILVSLHFHNSELFCLTFVMSPNFFPFC